MASDIISPPAAPAEASPSAFRKRLLFHFAGYLLTMLIAIPSAWVGITRESWDRDTRMTFGIGGVGLAVGSTGVLLAILFRLWKERREQKNA